MSYTFFGKTDKLIYYGPYFYLGSFFVFTVQLLLSASSLININPSIVGFLLFILTLSISPLVNVLSILSRKIYVSVHVF